MRKYSIWLTTIILLMVASFLFVFEPVTFSPRKDPADATRYLRPVGTDAKTFDPASATQKATVTLGENLPVYVYPPIADLNLGLDLRGGMRVVLQIASRGEFVYKFNRGDELTTDAVSVKKSALIDAVTAALGASVVKPEDVDVSPDSVAISTNADTNAQAQDQLTALNGAMTKVFGAEAYTAPDAGTVFQAVTPEVQNNVRSIMEKRVNPDGTKEVSSSVKGTNQIVLEIPGEKDPDHVKEVLGRMAELKFMLLDPSIQVLDDPVTHKVSLSTNNGATMITDADALKTAVLVARGRELDSNCTVTYDQSGAPAVSFAMRSQESRSKFAAFTGANVGRDLAIVLDDKVVSAPVIKSRIDGAGIITLGSKTDKGDVGMNEAKDLATLLNAGALPSKVNIVESRVVSASLGADSINKSVIAGMVGLLLVLIFMALYYRLPGLMADIALIIYIFLSLAVLKAFGSTLTLPGIAGIIISIGMAVDANVIIFERLKEELRTQKPLTSAIDVAFSRAWTAILDSNVASIITGFVLYELGTGAVRGFAITLLIGVCVSMFTAVTVTRLFMKLMIRTKAGHKLSWYGV